MKYHRYQEEDYDGLSVIVYALICIAIAAVLAQIIVRTTYSKGSLDCSECHSVEFYETKKMVKYLEEKKYKDPKRWLK